MTDKKAIQNRMKRISDMIALVLTNEEITLLIRFLREQTDQS